ncbi:MAG TPA: hypothetical protein VN894_07975 [Polyangiaceae bacterium]|nr:hypothetical protein [Polyangiaceae bacterium]
MISLVLAATTSAAAAAVPTGPIISSTDLDAPHRFRGGVAVGLTIGAGLAGASGYPNNLNQIGAPAYYSASAWMVGTGETLFLMGALTDYLSFGFWYAHATASNADWRSSGDGGGLRVEAFPLVGLVPSLHGLGVIGQFGLGSGNLTAKRPGVLESNGTQSFAAAGTFYEWSFGHFLGGHFGAGPNLEFDAIWSLPFERHGLTASARVVFYGGGG